MRKKWLSLFAIAVLSLSVAACGGKDAEKTDASSNVEEKDVASVETEEERKNDSKKQDSFKEFDETILADVKNTIASIEEEYEELVTDVNSYDEYIKNVDRIEEFYKKVFKDTKLLCMKMREYSIDYAEVIMASEKSNDDKYDDFDGLYDCIYDDAGDEIYDEIYDGILDKIYDDFYDGILDDAYDNVPYEEWSDIHSDEYERWSDTRSDVYEEWSDFRSDVYEFWSDMRSELWSDDIERAEEKMADFKEDVEKLKNKDEQNEAHNSDGEEASKKKEAPPTEPTASESEEQKPEASDPSSIDPDFKAALDSYEAFMDEYIEFMQTYESSDDVASLLGEYSEYMSKCTDLSKKIEDMDKEDMTDAELQYYTEVTTRVAQKLLKAV